MLGVSSYLISNAHEPLFNPINPFLPLVIKVFKRRKSENALPVVGILYPIA